MAKNKSSLNERVCAECKNIISVQRGSYDDVIYFDKKYYHKNCFISMCKRKSSKKNTLPKWKEALENIDKISSNTKEMIDTAFYKDDICNLIYSFYDLSVITTRIFQKLDEIYSGTFRGLSVAIPPSDLYDMWVRKKKYLLKIRKNNITKGKTFSGDQQVIYDLSILVNKYDSYLRWKEQQKIIEQTTEDSSKILQDINLHSSLFNSNKINKNNDNEDDINSLLDEIFD